MKKKHVATKEVTPEKAMKQLKVFLNTQEHAVVSTAAKMQGMTLADYMKTAIIQKAKIDARAFTQMIEDV